MIKTLTNKGEIFTVCIRHFVKNIHFEKKFYNELTANNTHGETKTGR